MSNDSGSQQDGDADPYHPVSHYETLGVSPDATDAEIKAAYRRASAAAHPDRDGGDGDRMAAVNVAYEVLSDPESRTDYDARGGGDPARERLIKLFESYIESAEGSESVIPRCRKMVQASIDQLRAIKVNALFRVSKIEKMVYRVKGPKLWESLCHKSIEAHRKNIDDADKEVEINEKILVMLADYSDAANDAPPQPNLAWYVTDLRG